MRYFLHCEDDGAVIGNDVSKSMGLFPWKDVQEILKTKEIKDLSLDGKGNVVHNGTVLYDGNEMGRTVGSQRCIVDEYEDDYYEDDDDEYFFEDEYGGNQ